MVLIRNDTMPLSQNYVSFELKLNNSSLGDWNTIYRLDNSYFIYFNFYL